MMLVRLGFCIAVAAMALVPNSSRAVDCADEVSRLMSKDTEKLNTRYQRIAKRIEKQGRSPSLVAEGCRIARALAPQLEDQIAALKQSNCARDPNARAMITDIVRGYEDDLAVLRKASGASECH
jgi:hypothetical protein